MRQWVKEWWVTLWWGSPFTRAGRQLRRNLKDGPEAYVEVHRPGADRD